MNQSYLEFAAVGDVALSDAVEAQMIAHGDDFPFRVIRHLLGPNHVNFCNLECALTESDAGLEAQAHLIRARPSSAAALAAAGFGVASLANNHIYDYGDAGVRDTIAALDRLGIKACGAGADLSLARRPAIVERNGIRLGFLAYTSKGVQSASATRAGAALIDGVQIVEDVTALRPAVDHVIVSLHAGLEFIDLPHPEYRELCHTIAAAGACLIVGHGPHVIQGIERVGQCVVCYSLGNFVFDLRLMDYVTPRSREGLILRVRFTQDALVDYQALPVVINSASQPEAASPDAQAAICERLKLISAIVASAAYRDAYFRQASEIWSKINIAVNLKVIREQGLIAFFRRLPRLKLVYLVLLVKFLMRKLFAAVR
jgi:hypothetical protein